MVLKKELFSVPIYFCSKSDFFKRLKQKREKSEAKLKNSSVHRVYNIKPEPSTVKVEWKFDKIVGWIEFYLNGETIKANFWFVKAQRIAFNLKRKEFECFGKIGDVSQTHRRTNEQIFSDIRSFLEKCQNGKYLNQIKKYHIETSEFLDYLRFLNLKGLIKQINYRLERR